MSEMKWFQDQIDTAREVARESVLEQLGSDEAVEVAWGHYGDPGEDATEAEELDAMRAALAALREHLEGK